jgi:hypothetical protein
MSSSAIPAVILAFRIDQRAAKEPGYDYGDEYEFGLNLILDGLESTWLRR